MAMAMDGELLEKSRNAATRLAEAERQVLLARAEYHTAIRRLHLAGGSLREIAEALALSHQRVQQIVNLAGGTWWTRMWRTRNVKRDAVCTFCDRPPSEVAKLVAGPNVYICDSCVSRAAGSLDPATAGSKKRCSFCAKRSTKTRSLLVGPHANVCEDCLGMCRDILSGGA